MATEHPFVDIDNYDIGYRAASYLYERKRTNIRLISSSQIYTYAWHKFYGVKRASMEFGVNFDKDSDIIFDTDVGNYRQYFKTLLENVDRPDGIICGSEISACGILAGAHDAGLTIGKDLDIVTIETCDLPSFFMPPIPGFRQNLHSVGRKLSSFLVKNIEKEDIDVSTIQVTELTTFHER
jgi:LacI family transcriptional regulator